MLSALTLIGELFLVSTSAAFVQTPPICVAAAFETPSEQMTSMVLHHWLTSPSNPSDEVDIDHLHYLIPGLYLLKSTRIR